MRSTPGSVVEGALAALLDAWCTEHVVGVELDESGPVLDGAAALGCVPRRELPPEACLEGVTDAAALAWAALVPGVGLVGAVDDVWRAVRRDVDAACRPVPDDPSEPAPQAEDTVPPLAGRSAEAPQQPLSDAELLEAVAACERQIAALTAQRDVLAGVFAARRQAEAEQDVADARAATAADGRGRPWATRVRSTGPSELGARLGIGSAAADALVERGVAAVGAQREVASAMAAGALHAGAGEWLLAELTTVRSTAFTGALEREVAGRETALALERAEQDAAAIAAGAAAPSRAELAARAAADRERVEAEATTAAEQHADEVVARVREELLERATGFATWPTEPSSELPERSADGADAGAAPAPATRPTAGAGLGPTKRSWKHRLTRAVHRADAAAARVRAAKARAASSTQRWNEDDDQAALLLRGPVETIALITSAMDARARRRQADARAAERAAAAEEGRPFDRGAVGTLDQHRIAALAEWATAALEISETSGVSGTWHPVARTAASKPSVHLVLPWTVLAGVSSVGAELAGYGPVGAAAALRIAADGLWRRVFADPSTGAAVGVEEGAWRPSTSLARLVSLRWAGSTLPGSTRPVGLGGRGARGEGQLDHVEPWAVDERGRPCGGPTEATNLQLLAQVEHLLKQAGEHARPGHGWSVAVDRTGTPPDDGSPPPPSPGDGVVWTSPTGHTYRVSPQRLLDPHGGGGDGDDHGDGGHGDGAALDGLPPWVHSLLADVLPAWVGWPPDGGDRSNDRSSDSGCSDGSGRRGSEGAAPGTWPVDWARDWATDHRADVPPSTADEDSSDGPPDDPCLFDDLPAN